IVWDLTHILPAAKGPELQAILDRLEARTRDFEAWRPKLDGIKTPAEIERILELDVEIGDLASRVGNYGHLAFSADTRDPEIQAFMSRMENLTTEVGNRTRFFDLWWKSLPDERAATLMPSDPEKRYYLERVRMFRPHTLTESEESIIALKDVTGESALDRIREIQTSSFKFKDPKTGNVVTQSELVKRVYDPDAAVREAAYKELWRVYGEHETLLSFLYTSVATDWHNENIKLRKYPSAINVRNKGNDVPDAAVEALLEVCRENREVFQRYFLWKAQRLGLPPSRYHIYAPLTKDKLEVPYEQAKQKVLDVFARFSPRIAQEARKVFDERHVHVYPGETKRGGAYCATVTSKMTPYVFLNHTGDSQSLKTLAHEMGHAIHSLLAKERFPFVAHSTLPMAETASVFAEMLLHETLMREASSQDRVSILSEKLAEIYATVERQAYFVIFEKDAHRLVMEGATTKELNETYLAQLREQFGPIEVPDDFQREWQYIPHIYASPFYCYAYSFGMLLSLALYGMYREQGAAFVPKYEKLLAGGGSQSPQDLLKPLGVDITDKAFWRKGFQVIEEMMRELEKS
ncbi:MAG TPA: M3 family oligoendopeptidase, partial [Candidatus Thermoplasmatota archaeon]|nr:M3 family oligoendopeptidase [Candidatus Thermoplasmatota archaeon]